MKQREIKFRAYDKVNKKMWQVVGISQMIYDKDCEGEPEWKHTNEVQEIAIREPSESITMEKPLWVSIENFELVEFTNLKDKNGKEVYEGDIVHVYDINAWCSLCETWEECDGESDPEHKEHGEHGHTNRQDCDLYICTQEVKWSEYTGYFCAEDTGEYCPALGSSDDVELERVGNIYENPDLLTPESK